jgi:peroxiredoxin
MKKLKINDSAIEFSVPDYLGNTINLKDYKGQKILLSFFRGASCPFCNMRVRELIKKHHDFEMKGIKVITFFTSSTQEIIEGADKQQPPFPIIPDSNLEIYQKYGVEQDKSGMLKTMMKPLKMMKMMFSGFFTTKALKDKPIVPADFLIDEHQIIYKAYYGKDFGDHIPMNEILNW